jgi:SGNH domain (fused to AT3 domains)
VIRRAGIALAAVACAASLLGPTAASAQQTGTLTAGQLAADISTADNVTAAPANLTPSAATAAMDYPRVARNGCEVFYNVLKTKKPCVYGDKKSRTSVVLLGDSHASAWFPGLRLIASQQHWRLVIFTKIACSPPEVTTINLTQPPGSPYSACSTWRHNTESQIAKLHPALVIVTWADWISADAMPEPGIPTPYASPWLNGVKAIFDVLRRSAHRVMFISDMPFLGIDPPTCVSQNLSDVSPCNNNPRSASFYDPKLRAQEIQLAKSEHINWIDSTPWFCSATSCPVVVDHFMVYRDNAHMTPAWSQFIAPVLADSLLPVMR